jgi:hypothetical protein
MNATSEMKTGTSRRAEQQTFIVLGVLLQFLSTPEQIHDQISVIHGTVPAGGVIPLHSPGHYRLVAGPGQRWAQFPRTASVDSPAEETLLGWSDSTTGTMAHQYGGRRGRSSLTIGTSYKYLQSLAKLYNHQSKWRDVSAN